MVRKWKWYLLTNYTFIFIVGICTRDIEYENYEKIDRNEKNSINILDASENLENIYIITNQKIIIYRGYDLRIYDFY